MQQVHRRRAETITRTETIRAASAGQSLLAGSGGGRPDSAVKDMRV